MTENKTYRIEELNTTGWTLIDERYQGLDKETTKEKLQWLIDYDERNPNRLRAVPERN
jgi:hypothetical protein|tara:strand:+ start:40 stop:213 length:174 start_codon:yes stop_codon:yes gene_type:complete